MSGGEPRSKQIVHDLERDRVGQANRMVRKELGWKRQQEHPDLDFQLLQVLAPALPRYWGGVSAGDR